MMNPFLFRMRYPNYPDVAFESGYYEGGGLQEEEYNRRRNRLYNVVKDYQSEADLLRDIEWIKSFYVF